jgi:hypothetical protein
MAYKLADELVPGDIFVEDGQAFWVIANGPGVIPSIVDVTVECLKSERLEIISFFRGNRVEMTGADDVAAE